MRQVYLFLPSLEPNDAVGTDVLQQRDMLKRAGYGVRIFAGSLNRTYHSLASKPRVDADELWSDSGALLLYHHAVAWPEGERILARSKNRIVVKYHNVTPAHYFKPYAANYYRSCLDGAAATERIAKMRVDYLWGDSRYNAGEFMRLGVPEYRCRIAPPIHRIEELAKAPLDTLVSGMCRDSTPNLLFVGAFRPNKGHLKALEVLAEHQRLSTTRVRLIFVGSADPALGGYVERVKQRARDLNVIDRVVFAYGVDLSQLRAYYTLATVFLCTSEHEGFGVPLVEAMSFRVPLVAWATTAVGETAADCGRIFPDWNPKKMAIAIQELIEEPQTVRELAEQGRKRYEATFHPSVLERGFLKLIQEAFGE